MAADKGTLGDRRPQHPTWAASARIDLTDPHEIAYWTKALGVNEELLRKIVAVVGDRADVVRKRLGK